MKRFNIRYGVYTGNWYFNSENEKCYEIAWEDTIHTDNLDYAIKKYKRYTSDIDRYTGKTFFYDYVTKKTLSELTEW